MGGDAGFVHLHVHSYFSLLSASASPEALVARAKALGQRALALTDTNNMFGAVRFYRAARAAGVKPIFGMQLDVKNRGSVVLLAENDVGYANLLRLATLARSEPLSSRAAGTFGPAKTGLIGTGSPYGRGGPVAFDRLLRHGDGLIFFVGGEDPDGPEGIGAFGVPSGGATCAVVESVARELKGRFGENHIFVQLQNQGLAGQRETNQALFAVAANLGLAAVATNDVRYIDDRDARAHAALLALGARTTLDDGARPTMGSSGFYLASEQDMRARFEQFPEAVALAAAVADRCNVRLQTGGLRLPVYRPAAASQISEEEAGAGGGGTEGPVPKQTEPEATLTERAWSGAAKRFGARPADLPEPVRSRLRHELDIICGRGLASYFLIVADIVDEARRRGIRVGPGRGSAASSMVAYCLAITDVDPLAHGLVFERFLNPERVRMPDIDIDVEDVRRDELLQYIRQRFGDDRVAQIVTFGTLAARAAVREAGRVLGRIGSSPARLEPTTPAGRDAKRQSPGGREAREKGRGGREQSANEQAADRIARLIPSEPGMTLERALSDSPQLQRLLSSDRNAARVFSLAKAVEGVPRHVSTHAAGVVIADGPLSDDVPLMHTAEGALITQFPMDDVEDLGFLKMDVLGLRTLTVIGEARRWVRQQPAADVSERSPTAGTAPEADGTLDLEDAAVYEALHRGGTDGVFQLETPMFRNLVRRLQPEKFEDIVALLALGRPGPMQRVEEFMRRRRGIAPVRYVHPVVEPVLRETFGIIVYQEQVMHIAMHGAGYSPAEADLLRRRLTDVGGGGRTLSDEERQRFVKGAEERGLSRAEAETVLAELVQFAGYGFAKSHSAAYGLLTFETAFLRTRHPAAFLAALLNSHQNNPDRIRRYTAAAKSWGVRMVGPDVNESGVQFRPMPQSHDRPSAEGESDAPRVVYGLAGIRNVGRGAAEAIVAARGKEPFRSFDDLRSRLPGPHNNARLLEALVRAGACDGFGESRERMLAAAAERTFQPRQMALSDTMGATVPPRKRPRLVLRLQADAGELPALQKLLASHKGDVPVTLELPGPDGGVVRIEVDRELWVDDGPALRKRLQSWKRAGKLTSLRREP